MANRLHRSLSLVVTLALSLALAFAMAMGISPVHAHAATQPTSNGKLTITNLADGDSVSIYKVATTAVNDDNTTTSAWVTAFDPGSTIAAYTSVSATEKQGIANKIATKAIDQTATATQNASSGSANFTGLAAGLYYVKVVNANNASIVYQSTLAAVNLKSGTDGSWSVQDDATLDLKKIDITGPNPNPNPNDPHDPADAGFTKKVSDKENGTYSDAINTLKTGDAVYYRISVTVPQYNANAAANRVFKAVDVLPTGVSFDSLITDDGNVTANASGQTVTFNLSNLLTTGKTGYAFIYKAKLTATAPSEDGFKNTVKFTFSQNSYNSDTATTSAQSAAINTANVKVTKTDSADSTKLLQGAKFELYSGNTKLADGTTGSDGTITLDSVVGVGTYTLKEVAAPAGYALANDTSVSITSDDTDSNGTHEVTVKDSKDSTLGFLPSTGASGTVMLTICGVLLAAGAITLVVRSRNAND